MFSVSDIIIKYKFPGETILLITGFHTFFFERLVLWCFLIDCNPLVGFQTRTKRLAEGPFLGTRLNKKYSRCFISVHAL